MSNPDPTCTVQNGGAGTFSTADGVNVTPGNTITIRLVSANGVDSWSCSCVGTDELLDADTITASLTIDGVNKTATFTAPIAGSALIFKSRVTNRLGTAVETTFGIYTLTVGSQRVFATNETTEGSTAYGWITKNNSVTRAIDGLLVGSASTAVLAGTVSVGDVICSASNATASKVVKATTANIALGGVVRGIAVTGGTVGQTISYAGADAVVAASVVGLGAGTAVNVVSSNGVCARKDTVDERDVVVGACDTTGNVTIAPRRMSGAHVLSAGDPKWGIKGDGTTDDTAGINAFLAAIPNGGHGYFPQPSAHYHCTDTLIVAIDDTPHGNKRTIYVEGPRRKDSGTTTAMFQFDMSEPNGIAGSVTAKGNGGSGQIMSTFALGTNSGRAVLAADEDYWKGKKIYCWNANDNHNNVSGCTITGVPSNGVVTFWNEAAVSTDYGLGGGAGTEKICWRIAIPGFDIRSRDIVVEGISAGPAANKRMTYVMQYTYPDGAGYSPPFNCEFWSVGFQSNSKFGSPYSYGIVIANDFVGRTGSAWASTNGAGVAQVTQPNSLDTVLFKSCNFLTATVSGILHISATGQSKSCAAIDCQFGLSPYAYLVPATVQNGGGLQPAAHLDFKNCQFAAISDVCVQTGGSCQRTILDGCYGESNAKVYDDRSQGISKAVDIDKCDWNSSPSLLHRSGEVYTTGLGPLRIKGGRICAGSTDIGYHHIACKNTLADHEGKVSVDGLYVQGTTLWTGTRARLPGGSNTINRGPGRFAGTETLTLQIDGGSTQTIGFSQLNLNIAGGYTVDLNEVPWWVVGNLIDGKVYTTASRTFGPYFVYRPQTPNGFRYIGDSTGGTTSGAAPTWPTVLGNTVVHGGVTFTCVEELECWGDGDNLGCYIESMTAGTGGSVHVTGGAANTQMGWSTASTSGTAQNQVSKDTKGIVDCTRVAGSGGRPVHLVTRGIHYTVAATDAQTLLHDINKRYGSAALGGTMLESVVGLSKTGGVPPRNFWADVTHTGTAATCNFTADAGTNNITYTAGIADYFTKVQFSTTTTLPAPLAITTDYWLVRQSSTTAKVATSLANAKAGTTIDITDAGTGTHTLTVQDPGSTFTWVFDTAEDDTSYSVHAFDISETGTPAANSRTIRDIVKTTTTASFVTTDPGSGATVTWHCELRR